MEIDLTVTYNGNQIDIDFSDCENAHDCLDAIIDAVAPEVDPEFDGFYTVNKTGY
tara:strand:+ start:1281 stop:1445 length:165 start_codon:yes stop_codon:yes gene_type:complete